MPMRPASQDSKPKASQSDAQQAGAEGDAERATSTPSADHTGRETTTSLSSPDADGNDPAQSNSDRGQTTTSIEGGNEAAPQSSNVTISFTEDWASQGQQSSANASGDDERQTDATAA